jgi:hypothetical protein
MNEESRFFMYNKLNVKYFQEIWREHIVWQLFNLFTVNVVTHVQLLRSRKAVGATPLKFETHIEEV